MGKNLMKIMNFSDDRINNLLATESIEHAKKAKDILKEQREKYKRGKPKKWVFFGLGIFIGLVLGIALPKVYQFFTNSLYDRSQMETLMAKLIGGRNVSESIFDELLIVAYEYNS